LVLCSILKTVIIFQFLRRSFACIETLNPRPMFVSSDPFGTLGPETPQEDQAASPRQGEFLYERTIKRDRSRWPAAAVIIIIFGSNRRTT